MCGPAHVLISARDIKIKYLTIVDPVCDFYFMIGQWNIYHEPPEGASAERMHKRQILVPGALADVMVTHPLGVA